MSAYLTIALAYVIGSLSFAVLTAMLFRLPDPRSYGSGNPGATNVLRSGSKIAALVTLLGDASKGAVAIWIASALHEGSEQRQVMMALAGLAAFLGHLYPVFFGFKGGKGVATALGIVLALNWKLGLLVLVIFVAVVLVTRYVSLASVLAALLAAPLAVALGGATTEVVVLSLVGLLIIWRHAANLRRLRDGTESKVLAKKQP